jgi:hypothetical protein
MRKGLALGLLLVAAGSKEILLLDVGIALLCWWWIEFRQSSKNFFIKLAITSPLLIIMGILFWKFFQFEVIPHPADKNYFNRYYSYLGHNLGDFFLTLFRSPWKVPEAVGSKELWKYIGNVFLPWFCLPLAGFVLVRIRRRYASKEFVRIIHSPWIFVILPSFASAALATYPPLRNSNFHYILELWPILASLTILVLSLTRSSTLIWVWAVFSLLRMDHDPIGDFREFSKDSEQWTEVRAKIREIPNEGSLVADELAGTWVAGRQWITRWPDTTLIPNQCPQFILVRNSEFGTLTELGVRTILNRCESQQKEPKINADLMIPVPVWRSGPKNGAWSMYRVNASEHSGR